MHRNRLVGRGGHAHQPVRMATNLALMAVGKEVDVETPIIELQDIRKSFGPVEVLKG